MIIIRKIENGKYELIEKLHSNYGEEEHLLTKLIPSTENKRQYDGLCFGNWERFRTIRDWKTWCYRTYGDYTMIG